MNLYKGSQSYITHESVAEKAGIDPKCVKVEHLSFFNKNWFSMQESPLFNYYSEHEPYLLQQIYNDKKAHGHKITSQKMFAVEVAIMTDVIKHLNSLGIYVLYVYDALMCEEKDKAVVIETMNRIVLEHGIKTTVKQENSAEINIDNAIVDEVVEASTTNRITLKEYFRRFNIRYGTFVTESSLDLNYKVLSKYFTYVDEVTVEWKKRAMIETYINGEYGKRQLFE